MQLPLVNFILKIGYRNSFFYFLQKICKIQNTALKISGISNKEEFRILNK